MAIYPKQLRFLLQSSIQQTSAPPCGALDRFRKFGLGRLAIKTNIMMRRWNFEAFPVSYPQCAGGGSLANREIGRVYCCIKDLIYVLGGPSNYYHQPVLTPL